MKLYAAFKALLEALWRSVVRTFVPQVVGFIVGLIAHVGLSVDEPVVLAFVTELFAFAYYVIVRALEEFRSRTWGRLLGHEGKPLYFDEIVKDF